MTKVELNTTIENFFNNHCSVFYDDYEEMLKDIKQNFLESACLDQKVVNGKVIFFRDDGENEHFKARCLADWYLNRLLDSLPLPLGSPGISDSQEQKWHDNLTYMFECPREGHDFKGLVDAIDVSIRKI